MDSYPQGVPGNPDGLVSDAEIHLSRMVNQQAQVIAEASGLVAHLVMKLGGRVVVSVQDLADGMEAQVSYHGGPGPQETTVVACKQDQVGRGH